MASNPFSIYQNHPLDSYINVAIHYVTIDNTGSSFTSATEDTCNATIFSVKDDTNDKQWFVCELHMDDINVHGTLTLWEGLSAKRKPTKDELVAEIKLFVDSAKADRALLGI